MDPKPGVSKLKIRLCASCHEHVGIRKLIECCKCRASYHYECIGITKEVFDANLEDAIHKITCPDCMRLTRRPRNEDTHNQLLDNTNQDIDDTDMSIDEILHAEISFLGDTFINEKNQTIPSMQNESTNNNSKELTYDSIRKLIEYNKNDIIKKISYLEYTLENKIRSAINSINLQVKQQYDNIMKEQKEMKSETEKLQEKISKLEKDKTILEKQILEIKYSIESSKHQQSKKIVIYGLEEYQQEDEYDIHDRIINIFQDICNVDLTGYIENFQRLGRNGRKRPLLIELISKRMTRYLLENKNCFKNTGLAISEQLNEQQIQNRKKLQDVLREERKKGKHAVIRDNQLYVEGKLYIHENENNIQHNQIENTNRNNNARLNSKADILECYLDEQDHAVLCISETWVTKQNSNLRQIQGYKIANAFYRQEHIHGGTAILVRNDIQYLERQDITDLTKEFYTECSSIELIDYNIILILIYRLDREIKIFYEIIDQIIEKIKHKTNKHIIIGGDFNLNFLNKTKRVQLRDTMLSCNLKNIIWEPTRITDTTSTCIDLIFTNNNNYEARVEHNGFSDHSTNELKTVNWNDILIYSKDINKNYEKFDKTLKQILNNTIPKKRVKLKPQKRKTWITKDLSKAYDRVSHKILLSDLYKAGIRGLPYEWMTSYLQSRKQIVQIEYYNEKTSELQSVCSELQEVKGSIPQGSVIGSILFLIYINNLPKILDIESVLFADDISLIFKFKKADNYNEVIKQTLCKITTWLSERNLAINLQKTKLIQFRPYQRIPLELNLVINGIKIEEVEEHTLLGLSINYNLNWKSHIANIKTKLTRFVYALSILKRNTNYETALIAYYAYAEAWLRFGTVIWATSSDAGNLFVMQKKCIRVLVNIKQQDSCRPHFIQKRILTLPSLYILEAALFVRRNADLFTFRKDNPPKRNLRPRDINNIMLPKSSLEMYRKGPYYCIIKTYNAIPENIKLELEISAIAILLHSQSCCCQKSHSVRISKQQNLIQKRHMILSQFQSKKYDVRGNQLLYLDFPASPEIPVIEWRLRNLDCSRHGVETSLRCSLPQKTYYRAIAVTVLTPGSPIPTTSKGVVEDLTPEDISDLHIDSEEEEGFFYCQKSQCIGISKQQNFSRNMTLVATIFLVPLSSSEIPVNSKQSGNTGSLAPVLILTPAYLKALWKSTD
ncbi:reverse transcriptase (RNA-dependent DNA polymerase) domain-containing protein [Phthorimaea operculella]|nr:reverse transcriptase (RNA-dependent DNA polymerase) domain-containing protein [Phthorimaea operculella]